MATTRVLERRWRERNGLLPKAYCAYSDEELLQEYMTCDSQDAFNAIQARHGAMVFRTCLRLLGDAADADDAAQTVFLQLSRQPGGARGSVGGWLHTTAKNTAIKMLRSRAARTRREQVVAQRKAGSTEGQAQLRDRLDDALSRLPKTLQEALVICYLEGREQQEAAVMLGCHQGTLSRRTQRGLIQLRNLLQDEVALCSVPALVGLMAHEASVAVPAAWSAAGASGVSWFSGGIAKFLLWIKTKTWSTVLGGAVVATSVAVPMIVTPPKAESQSDPAPSAPTQSFDHIARWKEVPATFQEAIVRAWPGGYVPDAVHGHALPGRATEWHVIGRNQDGTSRRVVAHQDKSGNIQIEIREGRWQGSRPAGLPQP
jgi:RNA polymerase sigma factor (sigma-70 family)